MVDANACDYESSRKLGLVCPFCSQAVFLRRGSEYDRSNKRIAISPAFSHYKSGEILPDDCELRSVRKDGEEYLKSLEIQSRNQRIDLYNKRLWDVIKAEVVPVSFKQVKKAFGDKWLNKTFKACRAELRKNLPFYLEEARQRWQVRSRNIGSPRSHRHDEVASSVWSSSELFAATLERCSFDWHLHQVIFEEVIEFLSTSTGGYAFKNLLLYTVPQFCAMTWVDQMREKAPEDAIEVFAPFVKTFNPESFLKGMIVVVVEVNWVKLFYSLETKDS